MSSVELSDIEIPLADLTIRGLEGGPASGDPILALHGWLDNAASFIPLASDLIATHRVIALDLPGHGLSDHRPPGVAYHFVDWVSIIIQVVDALGLEQFTLMGHSMGAGISTIVAGTFPERIKHAIFLEGLGPLTSSAEDAPDNLKRHIVQGKQIRNKVLKPYPSKELARKVLTQATGISDASADALIARGMVEMEGGGFNWRSDPRMRQRSAARLTEPQVLAFINQIMSPSILITATKGLSFGEDTMIQRKACLKGLEEHQLEGNHHVHMENPEDVGKLVLNFLIRNS